MSTITDMEQQEALAKTAAEARAAAISGISKAMGYLKLDQRDPNFIDTPLRWLRYLEEFCQEYDASKDLGVTFPVEAGFHAMLVESDIPFEAVCAHHLVPFLGRAHIGYVPQKEVVGLSKLVRVVSGVSHERPGIQETICDRVADLINRHLEPAGVIVVIQAEHTCMACRGVRRAGVVTSTSAVRGVFRDNPNARWEFYQLIASRRDL